MNFLVFKIFRSFAYRGDRMWMNILNETSRIRYLLNFQSLSIFFKLLELSVRYLIIFKLLNSFHHAWTIPICNTQIIFLGEQIKFFIIFECHITRSRNTVGITVKNVVWILTSHILVHLSWALQVVRILISKLLNLTNKLVFF